MPRYIYVMETATRTFPERYRVVGPDEDAEALKTEEDLTGTVAASDADAFFDALTDRFPPGDPCVAEEVRATRWETVVRNAAWLLAD